jgi:hypothetical protein
MERRNSPRAPRKEGPMARHPRGATTDQLRDDIDAGRAGNKVRFPIRRRHRWEQMRRLRERRSIRRSWPQPANANCGLRSRRIPGGP